MPHITQHHAQMQRRDSTILEAAPLPTLLIFALPIIMGNIFQQLYNIVDAIVIGKFLGNLSLGGISVASPVTDVANAVIIGGSIGVGVLAAGIFGGGDMPRLKRTHSTALIGGLAISVLLALLGIAVSGAVLRAQGTREDICQEALRYLYIIMAGLPFCFLYNYYASMLRSCGNSRTPFVILLSSSLLHAALDYAVVALLGLGIEWVALSTVFCQLFSAGWCMIYTHKNYPALALCRKELRFSLPIYGEVLGYAWAAALQQAAVCIGRLLVQGSLSSLGADTVTGFNMGLRVEQFLFCFSQGLSAALAVCVSQNMGHGSRGRARRFYFRALISSVLLALLLSLTCRVNAQKIISMFSDDPAVVSAGAEYIAFIGFFYIAAYILEMTQGFFRGLGRLKLTMGFTMLQILLRVALSFLLAPRFGITGIGYAVLGGWMIQFSLEVSYGVFTALKLRDA